MLEGKRKIGKNKRKERKVNLALFPLFPLVGKEEEQMKCDGHGQAKVLTTVELSQLFDRGFSTPRDKAIFAICLFTACRISECLQLEKTAITSQKIIFKKDITKGKRATREIVISTSLKTYLHEYHSRKPENPYYFPGYSSYLKLNQASKILKKACTKIGLEGVSTHSFRRTALTQMSKKGVPLRTIQEISGHVSLAALQRYLEVSEEDKNKAIKTIGW